MTINEITVFVWELHSFMQCNHPMLKHCTNTASLVNALYQDAHVLKAWLNFILGFYAFDIWGGVHFISAYWRVWINLQLPVFDNWRWQVDLDYIMCSILCICVISCLKDEMCRGEFPVVVSAAMYLQSDPLKLFKWATRDSQTQRRLDISKSQSKPLTLTDNRTISHGGDTHFQLANKVTPAIRRLIPNGQNRYKISVFISPGFNSRCVHFFHCFFSIHQWVDT